MKTDLRRKLLPTMILMLFVLSVLSANMTGVNALESPAIYVDPAAIVGSDYLLGKPFTLAIYTDYTGADVRAYQFTVNYDPAILKGVGVSNGDLIVGGSAVFIAGAFDDVAGELSLTGGFYAEQEVTSGPGILAYVTFKPVGIGSSDITVGFRTKLIGWDDWFMVEYDIVDAETMPTHIQHGFFDNTGADPTLQPPVAVITASEEEFVNEPIPFSGAGSYDPDGTALSYDWDFGDGTAGVGEIIDHTYTTIGVYEVTLVVTDADGQVSDPAIHTITIKERPAYATDLSGRGAWPEHHRHDISRHGINNTLYAKVMNLGTETVTAFVVFTVYDGRVGAELGTMETSDVTLTSLDAQVLTVEFDTTSWGTGKFYVKAQCFYDGFAGAKTKVFSFTVVP